MKTSSESVYLFLWKKNIRRCLLQEEKLGYMEPEFHLFLRNYDAQFPAHADGEKYI